MNILTKLKQIDELERGATPKPWKAGRADMESFHLSGIPFKNIYLPDKDEHGDSVIECRTFAPIQDAHLIENMRNAYPEMSAFIKGAVELIGQIKWANNDSLQQQAKDFLKKHGLQGGEG